MENNIANLFRLIDNMKSIKEYGEFHFTNIFGFDYKEEIDKAIEVLYDYIRLSKLVNEKPQVKQIARKDKLNNEDIKNLYDKLGSFRAVGKALKCDPKTVKNRLLEMGYTFNDERRGK